jgi:hypothetical protein
MLWKATNADDFEETQIELEISPMQKLTSEEISPIKKFASDDFEETKV